MISNVLKFIDVYYQTFVALTKSNPVLGGMIGLWGLGTLTFVCKNIPMRVWNFIKQQSTTTVILNSQDVIYYHFLQWMSVHKLHKFMRSYNYSGLSNEGTYESVFTVGYGKTFFFQDGFPVFLWRYKIDGNATEKAKEVIEISTIGRSTKRIHRLFEEIKKFFKRPEQFIIYEADKDGYWRTLSVFQKRELETLTIPHDTLTKLTNHIEEYFSKKDWFIKNGILYKTGILLQGPPGTGKTSLVTAMCTKYKKDCFLIDLNKMDDSALRKAIASAPSGSFILMEDIDAYFRNRQDSKSSKSLQEILGCSLIGILNALDGIACGIDRIIFATTNHPENLDPALLREGRFDLKLSIDYFKDTEFRTYIQKFYPNFSSEELAKWHIKPNTPPCKVQQLIFENKFNPLEVLRTVANKVVEEVNTNA